MTVGGKSTDLHHLFLLEAPHVVDQLTQGFSNYAQGFRRIDGFPGTWDSVLNLGKSQANWDNWSPKLLRIARNG